jgi:hypothetical protein
VGEKKIRYSEMRRNQAIRYKRVLGREQIKIIVPVQREYRRLRKGLDAN